MERLVRTLGRLADEFGEPDGEWIRLTHYFRQDDLAQMIGARREVVSTLLNQLREQGLITYATQGRTASPSFRPRSVPDLP